MTPTSTEKPVRRTWCGFAGTLHVMNFGKGRQVSIIRYDNGNTSFTASRGDGRKANFRHYESFLRTFITEDESWAIAREMADRHFAS